MKRIVSILLLMIICVMAVSCSEAEVKIPDGMKLASGEGALYYFFVPNAWTVKDGNPPTAFISATDMSNVSVIAYVLEAPNADETTVADTTSAETTAADTTSVDTTVEENPRAPFINAFWNEFCADAKTTLNEFTVVGDIIDTQQLGGFYAKQYVYTHKTGGVEYKHRMAVTYYGEMIIYVIYSSTAENYDSHAADVDKIIKEFQFKQ